MVLIRHHVNPNDRGQTFSIEKWQLTQLACLAPGRCWTCSVSERDLCWQAAPWRPPRMTRQVRFYSPGERLFDRQNHCAIFGDPHTAAQNPVLTRGRKGPTKPTCLSPQNHVLTLMRRPLAAQASALQLIGYHSLQMRVYEEPSSVRESGSTFLGKPLSSLVSSKFTTYISQQTF